MRRVLAFAPSVLLFFAATGAARAEPRSVRGAYSDYELQAIHDAEVHLTSRLDDAPEGKTIESVDFVRLDPIDRHDPLPEAMDRAHTTSRPWVLRRELLVREGQPWTGVLVDESARNLRRLKQLSIVLCVPMRGSTEDRVRLVVITKDVWSLYVDFDLAVTSGGLESLTLEPKESNIAGLHHTALGRFRLDPKTLSVGASYNIPRLDGRWLDILVDGNVVFNRESGDVEGGYGSTSVKRPLVTTRTEWSWSSATTVSNQLRRRYVNAQVARFEQGNVPWLWRERSFVQEGKITRSFGWETKNDVSLGATLSHARYVVPTDGTLDPAAVEQFVRTAVPIGEDRVGPFLQWHGYANDFLRTFDLETLGLQEDQRLGHDVWIRAYPVLRALGATRDFIGTYAGAAYGVPIGDGLLRASVEATTEATSEIISDASVKLAIGVATPSLGFGRFVFSTSLMNRYRNYLNVQSFVGGDTVLRGYPTRYAAGKDVASANAELRTRSLDLGSILIGAAAFYDVADAFDGYDHLSPKQSVGGGLRFVFPQIDRAVLRFDLGVPVGSIPSDVPPVSFFFAFHQATSLPSVGTGLAP